MKNINKRAIIIIICIVIILALIIIGLILFAKNAKNNENLEPENTAKVIETDSENVEVNSTPNNMETTPNPNETENPDNSAATREPTSEVEVHATPNPNRFQFGDVTPEDLAKYYAEDPFYEYNVHQNELYEILTQNRGLDASMDEFYKYDYYPTIPKYYNSNWEVEAYNNVPGPSLYLPAPEYNEIELYNLEDTKTTYIVFICEDNHPEIVSMYEDMNHNIKFDYISNNQEVYDLLVKLSNKITEADMVK